MLLKVLCEVSKIAYACKMVINKAQIVSKDRMFRTFNQPHLIEVALTYLTSCGEICELLKSTSSLLFYIITLYLHSYLKAQPTLSKYNYNATYRFFMFRGESILLSVVEEL